MAPSLAWVCIVGALLGSSLGRASLQAELGVSIHPAFSSSVYIKMDPELLQDLEDSLSKGKQELGGSQEAVCEILNTTDSGRGLHEVKTLPAKSFSFFVKPEPSFKKLVLKLSLQRVFHLSSVFYSDEDITLTPEDLTPSEGSQWTRVRVEHYEHKRRGLNRHAFRVSTNETVSSRTRDSWIWHGFQGFTVFAEGGAVFIFDCDPRDLYKAPVTGGYVAYSLWVMAGLVIVATVLLAALCFVWVYLKYQRKKKNASVLPMKHPVYEGFDEEVLERIKQKVEALREGKTVAKPDTVVVSYPPRKENLYILDGSGYEEIEGVSPEDHHYEDIEKYDYYKHLYTNDIMYQDLNNDTENCGSVSAIDNIYESIPYTERR